MTPSRACLTLQALLLASCIVSVEENPNASLRCGAGGLCLGGLVCRDGRCVAPDVVIERSIPGSPSNTLVPRLSGRAPVGWTVSIYTEENCGGPWVGVGGAGEFLFTGIPSAATPNAETRFFAKATQGSIGDLFENTSTRTTPCHGPFLYRHDDVSPATPVIAGSSPTSPSSDSTPALWGWAEDGSTVLVFMNADCSRLPAGAGDASTFRSDGVTAAVSLNSTTLLSAAAVDEVGNRSACSTPFTYRHDNVPPVSPSFTGSSPASPSSATTPLLWGEAEDGSRISIYTRSDCVGVPIGGGPAEMFRSPGLTVTVPPDSTTTFYAAATDEASNLSACSAGFVYINDTALPPP